VTVPLSAGEVEARLAELAEGRTLLLSLLLLEPDPRKFLKRVDMKRERD